MAAKLMQEGSSNRYVKVFVPGVAALAGAVAVNPVAGLDDAGQALDIEVDEITRMLVLVAHDGLRRIERAQPVGAGCGSRWRG